jgi:hypothetical protein
MTSDDEGLCDLLECEIDWEPRERPLVLPLWHYTDADGLEGILKTREVWASHFECMNDKTELTYGERLLAGEVAKLADELKADEHVVTLERFLKYYSQLKLSGDPDSHPFVTSFCNLPDSPDHWPEYGHGGDGYSVAIAQLPTPTDDFTSDLAFFVIPMQYDEQAFCREVRERFTKNLADYRTFLSRSHEKHWDALGSQFVALMMRTAASLTVTSKAASYKPEVESRIVVVQLHPKERPEHVLTRPHGGETIKYVKVPLATAPDLLPIAGVTVGPLAQGRADRRAFAVELLGSLGYRNPTALVTDSVCSYP